MTKLNSTGSFWQDSNGEYWSYDTQLTGYYKGYNVYNATSYSNTTAKHQNKIPYSKKQDIILHCCGYGSLKYEQDIKQELKCLKEKLEFRQSQRNTKKKKQDIAELINEINKLENILNEQEQEQKTCYKNLKQNTTNYLRIVKKLLQIQT